MRSHLPRFPLLPKLTLVVVAFVAAVLALLLVRGMTYRTTVEWSSQLPELLQDAFAVVSDYGILGLMGLFVVASLLARRAGVGRLARGIAAGIGVVLAYLSSEIIKVLVTEPRPCHNFSVTTIAACPNASDWSWPSNHATIAAAIAVAIMIMSPRLAVAASLPLALLIAVSRVVVGVHYYHDVLTGAFLAVIAVIVCVRWGTPLISGGIARARRRPLLDLLIMGRPKRPRPRPSSSTVSPGDSGGALDS